MLTRDDLPWENPGWIGEQFRRRLDDAGLPRIRLHDLRHTHALRHIHASLLLKGGVNASVISGHLGRHSAAITLNAYAHVVRGMQREAPHIAREEEGPRSQ